MSEVWLTIGVLAVATAAIRASGPVLVGGRELPPKALDVIALLAPALLAALVLVETFSGTDRSLEIDARALGLGAAAISLAIRDSIILAVAAAAITTAIVRAIV